MEDWTRKIGLWVDQAPSVQIVTVANVASILLTFMVILFVPLPAGYELESLVGIYLLSGAMVLSTLYGLRKEALHRQDRHHSDT